MSRQAAEWAGRLASGQEGWQMGRQAGEWADRRASERADGCMNGPMYVWCMCLCICGGRAIDRRATDESAKWEEQTDGRRVGGRLSVTEAAANNYA